ncbi:hypothetical protein [Streptomyces sp. NPDC088812]
MTSYLHKYGLAAAIQAALAADRALTAAERSGTRYRRALLPAG